MTCAESAPVVALFSRTRINIFIVISIYIV